MAYVYQHIRLDTNEVFYIGIGSDENGKYKRAFCKHKRNKYWYNITNKCNYKVEIITDNISWNAACDEEIYWIKYYGRRQLNEGTLVNLTDGGDGAHGMILSEESRKKVGLASKGRIPNEETRRKISKALKGKKLSEDAKRKLIEYRIGSRHTEESKEKNRKAHIGKKHTEESKRKVSEALKGRVGKIPNEETRRRMSEAQKGKKHSDEHKKKISESSKGRKLSEYQKKVLLECHQIRIQCAHCNEFFTRATHGRWHGDNCKSKRIIVKNSFW
jgi:hypothetical protein